MYTSLVLYRNELKNKSISKYKLIGIVIELIYSKIIFKKNKDLENFIKDVFSIEFRMYIMRSRSMIAAKIGKMIVDSENYTEYKDKLSDFINLQIEIIKKNQDIKEKKNEFNGWIK